MGLRPSRWIRATPYEILRFIGRGTSLNDYLRLKAALDRLQSTTVATSIRETTGRRLHRSPWINEWKELADASGVPLGIDRSCCMVLCGRARCRLGADHRPSLFPLEGRDRALAVPPGAQARRQAAGRLAIRLPAPAPQVGQRCALLRLRLRPARPGGAAVAARLRPGHRANAGRRTRTADLRLVLHTARG